MYASCGVLLNLMKIPKLRPSLLKNGGVKKYDISMPKYVWSSQAQQLLLAAPLIMRELSICGMISNKYISLSMLSGDAKYDVDIIQLSIMHIINHDIYT